jgi:hypothetical protein
MAFGELLQFAQYLLSDEQTALPLCVFAVPFWIYRSGIAP